MVTLCVVSDIHYAGPAEQARRGYEDRAVANPLLRLGLWTWRRYFWLRDPFAHNHRLDWFLEQAAGADFVVANGDYSCDSAFIGVADDAAFASAQECLGRLRTAFGDRLETAIGDHELGKTSFFGGAGGVRFASWERTVRELRIPPFWSRRAGRYVLLGVTSNLLALPVFDPDILPNERPAWERERAAHLAEIRAAFGALNTEDRVLLFCHDPTALPFLHDEAVVRERLGQIELTLVGHLHSPFVLWQGRQLAGVPRVNWLGNTVRRYTNALSRARVWRAFNVRLCPSPAGIQLLKDGGFLRLELDPEAQQPARIIQERMAWS